MPISLATPISKPAETFDKVWLTNIQIRTDPRNLETVTGSITAFPYRVESRTVQVPAMDGDGGPILDTNGFPTYTDETRDVAVAAANPLATVGVPDVYSKAAEWAARGDMSFVNLITLAQAVSVKLLQEQGVL